MVIIGTIKRNEYEKLGHYMKQYPLEIKLLLLSSLTFIVWYFKFNEYILLLIYGSLLIYLIYKQKEFSSLIIIVLYAIMSNQKRGGYILIDYCLVLFLFCYVIYLCIKEKKIVLGTLFFPLLIYVIYNALSLIWTPVLSYGIDGLFAILEGYLIYFIITNRMNKINDPKAISKIASFLLFTLTLEILSIYLFHGPTLIIENKKLLHLGWAMSNIAASIFVFLIPIALYKYLNHKELNFFYIILDFINILGLILTLSRGAYLGVFVSCALLILIYGRKKILIRYGSILLFVLLLFYYLESQSYQVIINYLNQQNFFNDRSRSNIYQLGWDRFRRHLIFGEGIKSSEFMIFNQLGRHYSHYHNFILQIAATLGTIGLILFFNIIYRWHKILDKPKDSFVKVISLSIIGVLIHQLVDVSFDLYFFGIYFYLLIGIVEIIRHDDSKDLFKMRIESGD